MSRIFAHFFLIMLVSAALHGLLAQDSLVFIVRVDDIQSRNVVTQPRSILPFQNAVAQRGGKVTWAVIPHRLIESQNTNGVLSKELRSSIAAGHEISVHGYIHICTRCNQSGHEMYCASQSYGFSLSQQKKLVADGLKILLDTLGVVPTSFVPPGHYCDTVTFQALLDHQLPYLSATRPTKSYIYKNLYNLSPNNEYTWQLTPQDYQTKLAAAIQDVMTKGVAQGYYCLLLHDPFIRDGYENGLVVRWTGELLDSINARLQGRVIYMTLSEASERFRNQPTSIEEESSVPVDFLTVVGYPNPFNPHTSLRISLREQCILKLRIFDGSGQLLEERSLGMVPAGVLPLALDGSGFASGVIFAEVSGTTADGKPVRVTWKGILLR